MLSTHRLFRVISIAAGITVAFTAPALPLGRGPDLRLDQWRSERAHIEEGAPVLAPFGHVKFCLKNADECSTGPLIQAASFDEERLIASVVEINRKVNAAIRPEADRPGADVWSLAPERGDCEDYAITKRSLLISAGWPVNRVLLAGVVIPDGQQHMVLIVRTDGGDLVLDNLDGAVRSVAQKPYRWTAVQSQDDPHIWRAAHVVKVKAGRV